jgi:hypothetical protein
MNDAENALEKRRLSSAIRSDEPDDLARRDM